MVVERVHDARRGLSNASVPKEYTGASMLRRGPGSANRSKEMVHFASGEAAHADGKQGGEHRAGERADGDGDVLKGDEVIWHEDGHLH